MDQPPITAKSKRFGLTLITLLALTFFAAIVRILGTRNDFWLDEIISQYFALNVHSIWQIFHLHNDNNHYLNTLYIYLLGPQHFWPVYRYFSVLCGVATIPAGYWMLAARSRTQAIVFATMLAFSYPLIHFSSEARGNAAAVFGCVVAAAALMHFLRRPGFLLGMIYSFSIIFAFLAHLTACVIWGPLGLWSLLILLFHAGRSPRKLFLAIVTWTSLNLLPILTMLWLYQEDLRFFYQLGGPPITLFFAVSRFLALIFGWPLTDASSVYFLLVPLFLLALWQLWNLMKGRDPLFLLLLIILITPAISLFLFPPRFFFARYLLVETPFIYLLITLALVRLAAFPYLRFVPVIALALFCVGQLFLFSRFLAVGRGQFLAAFKIMTDHTHGAQIDVTSNEDLRAAIEIPFYSQYLPPGRSINYIAQVDQDLIGADWYIMHREGYEPAGPPTFTTPGQPPWYRARFFPASELSGQAWTLYCHIQTEKPNP